jgi:Spy/CpxP family protein refolding chaperone
MKNQVKIAVLVFAISFGVMAQKNNGAMNEKIEAARIGMITNRLNLTPEQATAFWPVYNEYEDKKTEVKKGLRVHLSESRSLASTDDKIKVELNEMMSLRQKEIDLDKEYMQKFLKVLQPRQVSELYKTEQQFKQMLLRRLENRQEKGEKGTKGPKGVKSFK